MPFHLKRSASLSVSGHYPEKSVLSGKATNSLEVSREACSRLVGKTVARHTCMAAAILPALQLLEGLR